MRKPTTISFDLDGTLVDYNFVNAVWLEGIPGLYAQEKNIEVDVAKLKVRSEYDAVGMQRLEWYKITYWLERFQLGSNKWKELFGKYKHMINVYPEVPEVLQILKKRDYEMIIVSNAARSFLDFELKETGLSRFFQHAFSATSDFHQVKNTQRLYIMIVNQLATTPSDIIHIGDHWLFDYTTPKKAGIRSFFVDRKNSRSGRYVVKNIREFLLKIP